MNRLLPKIDRNEHDVIKEFSTVENTLDAGVLVSIASSDPSADELYQTTNSILGSADHVLSPYWVNPNKVQTATSGALRSQVLGITLNEVRDYDEHGRKLLFEPQRKLELNALISGDTVPILRRGYITLSDAAFVGSPTKDSLGIVGSGGCIEAVTRAELTGRGLSNDYVIGKFISSTGNCGGYNRSGTYAYFLLDV